MSMSEPRPLSDRAARRVYHALAWVHARAATAPIELKQRLRSHAKELGIGKEEARALEAEARKANSVRLGREDDERDYLRKALADLAALDSTAAQQAATVLRHLAPKIARACPFEESEAGPPLVSHRLVPVA